MSSLQYSNIDPQNGMAVNRREMYVFQLKRTLYIRMSYVMFATILSSYSVAVVLVFHGYRYKARAADP